MASLAIALPDAVAAAEPPFPGVYTGTYHVDRWGRERLLSTDLAVSAEVGRQLARFRGQPIAVDVVQMGAHPTGDPSKASILKVGEMQLARWPLQATVVWLHDEPNRRREITRIRAGDSVQIELVLRNVSATPLRLDDGSLFLCLDRARPSGAGLNDPLEYWPGAHVRRFNLIFKDQSLDVLEAGGTHFPGPKDEDARVLRPGERHHQVLSLRNLPPNEYELSVQYARWDHVEQWYVHRYSNFLRLDVLTHEPGPGQGLEIQLEARMDRRGEPGRGLPMQIRFRNLEDQPLRFGLRKRGGQWNVWHDMLLCYDRNGSLLQVQTPDGPMASAWPGTIDRSGSTETVRLVKGHDLLIPVELPPETYVARVAFLHRHVIRPRNPRERTLDSYGYVFSPHVIVGQQPPAGAAASGTPRVEAPGAGRRPTEPE